MHKYLTEMRQKLINYACTFTLTREQARDLVHDVLLKAWENQWLGDENNISLPYMKTMVYNHFLNEVKRHYRFTRGSVYLSTLSDIPETHHEGLDELYEKLRSFIHQHKYGYLIIEMDKRNVTKIKDLSPYLNESKKTLYYRYQKLLRDLKGHLKGGGGIDFKHCLHNRLRQFWGIFERKFVIRSKYFISN